MSVFQYVALNGQGSEVRGQLDAPDARAAASRLRGQSLFVTELSADLEASTRRQSTARADLDAASRGSQLRIFQRLTTQDRIFFFQQMALMVRSGLTLLQALDVCREQTTKMRLAKCIEKMMDAIQAGKSFSQAMDAQGKRFSRLTVRLVESAEASGELDMTLDQIAEHLTEQAEMITRLITSLIYPVIIILFAIGVSIIMLVYFVPKIEAFLGNRQVALPWTTQALIDLSHFVKQYGLYILAAVLVTSMVVGVSYSTRRGRLVLDRFLLSIPVVGNILLLGAMIQLNRTLAMLLRSGLTLLESLQIGSKIVSNRAIAAQVSRASEKILQGQDLASSLRRGVIPRLVTQVVAVGERTGTLSDVLAQLGEFYDRQLKAGIRRMMALFEPVMIVIIGVMVFVIYGGFFMAIFQLVKNYR